MQQNVKEVVVGAILGAVVVGVLLVFGVTMLRAQSTSVDGNLYVFNNNALELFTSVVGGVRGELEDESRPGRDELVFAASAGPDRFSPCESRDGVQQCFERQTIKQATTTVCAIQSPAATSTLVRGYVRFNIASTSATVIHLAKAATQYATTTSLGTDSLGTSAQATMFASTTPDGVNDDITDPIWVFKPSQYFVVGLQGGDSAGDTSSPTGLVPTGVCQATFEVI